MGEILVSAEQCEPDDVQTAVQLQKEGDPRPVGEILVSQRVVAPTAIAEALKAQIEHHDVTSNTIRVDVGLLDKVMNLVGELVLARNQVLQFTATQEDAAFSVPRKG